MTTQIITYNPTEGHLVLSANGYQQVTSYANSDFNYQSSISDVVLAENKFLIDSSWKTGNIYYANGNTLYKYDYQGTLLASNNSFSSITGISVSQKTASYTSLLEEDGCFVADTYGSGTVYFVNKNLVITDTSASGLGSNIKQVISNQKVSGCFVCVDSNILMLDSNLNLMSYGTIPYSLISAFLTSPNSIENMWSDIDGQLYVLFNSLISKIHYNYNSPVAPTKEFDIDPLLDLSNAASTVNDFDIDTTLNPNEIYVTGGRGSEAWILKYNTEGGILDENTGIDMVCPISIRSPKVNGNSSLYILGDPNARKVFTYADSNVYKVAMSDNGERVIACCSSVSGGTIYLSDDFGETWAASASAGSHKYRGVTSSSNGRYLAALADDYVYTSNDYGVNWVQRNAFPPNGGYPWIGLAIASSSDGSKIAVINYFYRPGYTYYDYLITSSDYGTTWGYYNHFTYGETSANISLSYNGTKIIMKCGWLYYSWNFGGTLVYTMTGGQFIDLASSSDCLKSYVASGVIWSPNYISNDYGATWSAEGALGLVGFTGVSMNSDGSKVIITNSTGQIYLSDGFATNWSLIDIPGLKQLVSMSKDGKIAFYSDYNQNLYKITLDPLVNMGGNRIYKFNKDLLSETGSMELFVSNANSLIISQVADITKSYSNTISFTISSGDNRVPYLKDEEMMTVIRERVNLTAHGPNPTENTSSDQFERPYRPSDLPAGFIELKGENI